MTTDAEVIESMRNLIDLLRRRLQQQEDNYRAGRRHGLEEAAKVIEQQSIERNSFVSLLAKDYIDEIHKLATIPPSFSQEYPATQEKE